MTIITLVSKHTRKQIVTNKGNQLLLAVFSLLLVYAGISGLYQFKKAEHFRLQYQQAVRNNWVNSPDKHPHRMAHYGFIAFRPKSTLSIIDYGIESYTGNAVFLEAHRQNSTNFSNASMATSMLRFGEISIGMLLQTLLPLLLFFMGFAVISADRENGTLKLWLVQNATPRQIVLGKIKGLFTVSLLYIIAPAFILSVLLQLLLNTLYLIDTLLLCLFYSISAALYCAITVMVSAISASSKQSLIRLLALWIIMVIVLPKLTRLLADTLYPAPSKIAFETAVEKDIVQYGDSHNPEDPKFKQLKDSVLKANKVTSTAELSFNYSGFQMKTGEEISSMVYNKHFERLTAIYQQQIAVQNTTAFISPYTATKQLSMALAQTDFNTYVHFQKQAEQYRYDLAQAMNDLQIAMIPNKKLPDTVRNYHIDKKHWAGFKDFTYQPLTTSYILKLAVRNILYLLLSVVITGFLLINVIHKFKVI